MKGWYGNKIQHGLASKGIRSKITMANGRILNSKYFELEDNVYIKCWSEKTSRGFRHLAEFYVDGQLIEDAKVVYSNRTWEKYEFESVIEDLLRKMDRPDIERQAIMGTVENQALGRVNDNMKTIAMVSSLGDIFGTTDKERNDWKLRMIKAGMGEGLNIPDDWDTLSEEVKGERLDKMIEFMNESNGIIKQDDNEYSHTGVRLYKFNELSPEVQMKVFKNSKTRNELSRFDKYGTEEY